MGTLLDWRPSDLRAVEAARRRISETAVAILDSGACGGTPGDAEGTYTPEAFLEACLRAGGARGLGPPRDGPPQPGDAARYCDDSGAAGWVVCIAPNRGVVCRTGWNGLAVIALDLRPRIWRPPAGPGEAP